MTICGLSSTGGGGEDKEKLISRPVLSPCSRLLRFLGSALRTSLVPYGQVRYTSQYILIKCLLNTLKTPKSDANKRSEVAQGSCLFIELSIFQVVLDFGPITAREIGIITLHPLFTEKEM